MQCQHVHRGMPAPKSSQQQKAQEALSTRCASFSPGELQDGAEMHVLNDPPMASDPFRRGPDLAAALQARDPLMLARHATSVYQQRDQDVRSKAWLAAVCEGTGQACGAGDRYVLESCALGNICAADRHAALAAMLDSDDARARYERLYSEMVAALKAGNLAAFRP
jgi:hypothetical protein